ncbi:MAG: tandem-95 repeat protein, partial [Chitinispirillaceae bacterium]|nr:tandem-95 repeat protein [Chitinispirillaceae bacterium]
MRIVKNCCLVLFAVTIGFFHYCGEMPTDGASPEAALTLLALRSSTGVVDTVIVDSTEKEIEVLLAFELGYFIDSLKISIFSAADSAAERKLDTMIVIRFGPDDVRDTTRLNIMFHTGGERRFEVVTYKQRGYISTVTATAFILAPPDNPENSPPQFISETPRKVYRIEEGAKVRFAVAATDIDGDQLSYSFFFESDSLPRADQAVLENGFFEWQSEAGDIGKYSIVFLVSDGNSSTTFLTTILVGDVDFNEAPEIISNPPTTAKTGVLYEYQPIAVDADETGFSWQLLGALPSGMQFDSLSGKILWIPAKGEVSSGPLTLKVTDFGFPPLSDSQRIVITVSDGNRAPVAKSQSVATGEGVPVTVTLSATDWDDSLLTYEIIRQPLHGSAVLGENGELTYTPETGFKGIDTISWAARDSALSSDTVLLRIYVAMENQKPVAHGQQLSTVEDVALSLLLTADDVESDGLTYSLLEYPTHGILTGSGANWLYTPYSDVFGADTFTFYVNDGKIDSDPAMVIIVISSVNDTPVIADMGIPTAVNTPVTFTLSVNDPDDSVFTYELEKTPSHGTIDSSNLPGITYTPESGFTGNDTLSYRATDAVGCVGPSALIVFEVGLPNQRPLAFPSDVTGSEDTPVNLTLNGRDPDGSPLSYVIVDLPKHGTLNGSGPERVYSPYRDFNGSDTLQFTASDGMLVSEPASVIITVEPVNDLPLAQSQSVAVLLNGSVTITLGANDVDDTSLTFNITGFPENGQLDTSIIGQGQVIYTPDDNFKGSDTLRFVARDASGGISNTATVIISVAVNNQRPVADPQSVTINEDVTQTIFLTGSDLETSAANLIYSIVDHPKFGQLEGNLPNISYKTATDFNGNDTFWFAVNDGALTSEPARVVIEVLPVNDPPSAVTRMVTTGINASVAIQLQAKDVDDMVFTYEVTSNPLHGTVATDGIASGWISYTPATGFKGYDSLWYRALDPSGLASTAVLITVGVALDNQPPVAISKTIMLNEDTPKDDSLTGTDVENSPLLFTIIRSPVNGRLEGTLPKIRYIPNQNFFGSDSLLFTVSDGSATSASAVVRFTINPINDAPVGITQSLTTGFNTGNNTPLQIVLAGSDIEGGLLSYHIFKKPVNGTLDTSSIGNARIFYIPNQYFKGLDTILFIVQDAASAVSSPTAVIIGVALENLPPWAVAQQLTTNEDTPLSITIMANDIDGPTLSYSIVTNPTHGTLSGSGQNYTYTSTSNFYGTDFFEFSAHDGQLGSNIARVDITVNAVNDPPVVSTIPGQIIIRGGTFNPVQLDNYVSDPDNTDQQLTWMVTTASGNLTVSIVNRIATIEAKTGWEGEETVTYTARDPGALTHSVDVVYKVNPNTAPTITPINDIPLVNQGVEISPVLFTISDAETPASALEVTAVSDNAELFPASAITLSGSDAGRSVLLVPVVEKWGEATITVSVTDHLSTVTETFSITVNGRPVADPQTVTIDMNEDEFVNITLTGSDPEDGTFISFVPPSTPSHGTLVGTAPNVRYTPTDGYAGPDAFTFTVIDPDGFASAPATVSIIVVGLNQAPTITEIADQSTVEGTAVGPLSFTIDDAETPVGDLVV